MSEILPNIQRKVLLVDDEANIVHALTRLLLEEDDLEVLGAVSGAEGLELLREHLDVGLILSDQRMPGMTGVEFLQQARGVAPDAVRMILTGYADMAATVDAINKGGASRYLTKPWDDDLLRSAVLDGLEQYRLVQENRRLTALVERQNAELAEWNSSLKGRLMEQTATIRRQNEELKASNQQVGLAFGNCILAFSRLIALHSSRLQEHTDHVTELSMLVAGEMKLGPEQTETIRKAALLHDIGAIGVPLEILNKPDSARTREEQLIFTQHSVRGQAALEGVEELREAGFLIRHHHERYDGTGFPDALGGTGIPLGARIIAFADFVDHQIANQPGRDAIEAAVEQAARELGRQLDPDLFEFMVPQLRAHYSSQLAGRQAGPEKELRPKQLLPGMIVTRDLYCATGLCILTTGTVLDNQKIGQIGNYYRVDPPRCGIHVSWSNDQPGMRAGSLEREDAAKKPRANPLAEAFRSRTSRN